MAFAIYYGKFQGIAPKASRIISLVENRIEQNAEYDNLLNELHKIYLSHRASVSSVSLKIKRQSFELVFRVKMFSFSFFFRIDNERRN